MLRPRQAATTPPAMVSHPTWGGGGLAARRPGYNSRSLGPLTHQRAHRGGGEAFCKMTISCKTSGPTGGGGGAALFKATMTMAGGGGARPLPYIYIVLVICFFFFFLKVVLSLFLAVLRVACPPSASLRLGLVLALGPEAFFSFFLSFFLFAGSPCDGSPERETQLRSKAFVAQNDGSK